MVVGVPVVRTNAVLAEHLPDGLGQTLLERIRLDPAFEATQMIVVSADASEHSWKAAQGAGVRAFLNKAASDRRGLAGNRCRTGGHLTRRASLRFSPVHRLGVHRPARATPATEPHRHQTTCQSSTSLQASQPASQTRLKPCSGLLRLLARTRLGFGHDLDLRVDHTRA